MYEHILYQFHTPTHKCFNYVVRDRTRYRLMAVPVIPRIVSSVEARAHLPPTPLDVYVLPYCTHNQF